MGKLLLAGVILEVIDVDIADMISVSVRTKADTVKKSKAHKAPLLPLSSGSTNVS
jgi:hypothetical protein